MESPVDDDYTVPDDPVEFALWVERQSQPVKDAAKAFPLGHPLELNGIVFWVVGYSPEGYVVTIRKDPTTIDIEQLQVEVDKATIIDPGTIKPTTTRH